MAVKKTTKKKEASATPTKAEAKETAPKKKAAKPKAAAAAPTPAPTPEPTPAPKKAAAPKKPAPAPIKLTTSQDELLKKIGAAEAGYAVGKKIEQRSIDSLIEKKLVKKGAKDKASGAVHYLISSAGKKHLGS